MILTLYDSQQAPVTGFCQICGMELYGNEEICWDCHEEQEECNAETD